MQFAKPGVTQEDARGRTSRKPELDEESGAERSDVAMMWNITTKKCMIETSKTRWTPAV